MTNYKKYDLIIIGGGSAAFNAAIKAESFGIKTVMIERKTLGGTCVNVGCVPGKNLLGFGEIIFSSKKPSYKTIIPCENNFDFFDVITNKDNLVKEYPC